jgi:cytochrome c553
MFSHVQHALIIVGTLAALPATPGAQEPKTLDGGRVAKAQYNWVMHCQGCHGAEAQGTPGSVPRLAGNVARFLQFRAGRAYLGRVPGVAFVELPDADVAELLNWIVQRFDGEHVPKTFTLYSEKEVEGLRQKPLISGAYTERQKLLQLVPGAR